MFSLLCLFFEYINGLARKNHWALFGKLEDNPYQKSVYILFLVILQTLLGRGCSTEPLPDLNDNLNGWTSSMQNHVVYCNCKIDCDSKKCFLSNCLGIFMTIVVLESSVNFKNKPLIKSFLLTAGQDLLIF